MARAIRVSIGLLVVCLASAIVQQNEAAQPRHRFNVHEPLFADEDLVAGDVHTVTAGTRQVAPVSPTGVPASPARVLLNRASSILPAVSQPVEFKPSGSSSSSSSSLQTRGAPLAEPTPAYNLPKARLTSVDLKRAPSTSKRQISTPVISQDAPIVQQLQVASARSASSGSAPKHWSALKNYYDKLRPPAWEETRARQPQAILPETSQQKLYDGDYQQQLQLQQLQPQPQLNLQNPKQIYTADQLAHQLVSYPTEKSPFDFSQLTSGQQQYTSGCRFQNGQPAMVQVEQIIQQPISDYARDFYPQLPDKIFFNQQQVRARHQQDTFGPLVDRGIQEQLQLEEMNCGPRNVVRNLLGRRQQVTLAFGEYPSHVGLYNGSQANDNSYVCGATLIHSRFALTLASCVANHSSNINNLFVRTGDWNANRKLNEADRQLMMMVRPVAQVHRFPRYHPSSSEHNLALVEWDRPIDFPGSEYISPACQAHSRSSLRMRQLCWAPIRNITTSQYFDAEGDGETKLRRDVQMVELPINLIANDDVECRKQTEVDAFNFQHPNQICSGELRKPKWQEKLKNSQFHGSGIYCDEGGMLSLVSMMHPLQTNTSADFGYLDLSFYRPWMRNVIASRTGFIRYPQ